MADIDPRIHSYVLVTAAYNEARLIEGLIRSVIAQTVRPLRWVIVSDGSTDGTDDIVKRYAMQYEFIELLRIDEDHPRNFAAQAQAINAGICRVKHLPYEFIGNLDADVTFEPTYFSNLLDVFANDSRLGLAGGSIYEESNGSFQPRALNHISSVAHTTQFFRRGCFEALGECYLPLPYGGADWYAAVRTRMLGWEAYSVPQLKVFHHRPGFGASGWKRTAFRQGRMDYSIGTLPIVELFRILHRVGTQPVALYACVRLIGYCASLLQLERRIVSKEFIKFIRKEEVARIRKVLLKPVNTLTSILRVKEDSVSV